LGFGDFSVERPISNVQYPLRVNYFAHALPWLDESAYQIAGTAVPDWLAVCDRSVRVRRKSVAPWLADSEPIQADVARGTMQHLVDDARFHESRAFAELNLALTVQVRDFLDGERGFRPSLLGHLLVEVLLDAELVARHPAELERYYRRLDEADPAVVQRAVVRMARGSTERLAPFIVLFRRERILSDYAEDGKLIRRVNQVMRRVRCEPLPVEFGQLLPAMRRQVTARSAELLEGIPAPI
jgi:hypothetical protein